MAAQENLVSLSVVYKTLLELESSCQTTLNSKIEEYAAEFEWLDEIADEAFKLFSVKSTRLEEMPKTPSMKARGQKRARQKVIESTIKAAEESPPLPKRVNTMLKFANDEEMDDNKVPNRPVRNCRVTSIAVYVAENEPPKKSTRQSRNAHRQVKTNAVKENDTSREEDQGHSGEKMSRSKNGKKNVKTDNDSSSEDNGHNTDAIISRCKEEKDATKGTNSSSDKKGYSAKELSNTDVKIDSETNADSFADVAKIKKCTPVLAKEKPGQKNSIVRDRTKAYECMLKQRVSQSPVQKLPRIGTPGSANKAGIIVKVSTPIRADATAQDSGNVPSSNSKIVRRSLHSELRNSLHRMSGKQRSSGSKRSSVSGTRQTRTRLKLKKQKQDNTNIPEAEQPSNSESSSTDHPSQDSEDGKGPEKDNIVLGENIIDNGKYTHLNTQHQRDLLNETETVITEVFEIVDRGQTAKLKEYEVVHTKTTPVVEVNRLQGYRAPIDKASDQGFADGDDESANDSSDGCELQKKRKTVDNSKEFTKSTRTRARQKIEEESSLTRDEAKLSADSCIALEVTSKADSTFTKDRQSSASDVKGTRTRTRAQKEPFSSDVSTKEAPRVTRTRQRKQEETSATSQDSKPVRTAPVETHQNTPNKLQTATRSRMRNVKDKLAICGSDDEIIAGSPVVGVPRLSLRGAAKKRLAEERGLSPRPKRSCVGDQSTLNMRSPQLASSPIKNSGADLESEEYDRALSPLKSPRAFKFNTAQKKTSGFLNRTPGFGQNTSKLYSFLSNTPTCRSNSFLTSFLKRNTPPPKQNNQFLAEQKRQKLLEKETQEKERLKKAAELRKRKIEDQKRLREEKEHKVAEAREMKMRNEQEQQKSRINKKFEDKALVKEKLLEERCKEEREKQKQRLKKQIEADARRKMEEEDRLKKRIEQEEEAKMHAELMQRKKEYEEAERKRQIAEDKRKQEERVAELEQRRQEEVARLKQAEEEKDRERERNRLEKERMIAYERAEKERLEREKREEKERKLLEELDKLKAMEKERLRCQQEKAQQQKQEAIQEKVIKQMINKHNTTLSKQSSSINTSTNAANTSSYDMTPQKIKMTSKNKNPENYDIDDKNSDDSTDDEEAPMKQIPEWASGIPLNSALIRQHMNPPDLECIFRTYCIEPPNLVLVFPGKKKPRYHQRTSSAIWNSPPFVRK